MIIDVQKISYQHEEVDLEGYCAINTKESGEKPCVLVVHDWSGRNEFAEQQAKKLAEWGYVGFALDMYGVGKVGKTNEEKMALMNPLINDRALLRDRILAAYERVKQIPGVDENRIGVMGFCFGGLCALDLARSGADIKGAASVHGLLFSPPHLKNQPIHAKVLALHGYDDPMVPTEQVLEFEKEMKEAGIDWQLHVYGNTVHAFTNPLANDPDFGTVYNPVVAGRAFVAVKNFFDEVLLS